MSEADRRDLSFKEEEYDTWICDVSAKCCVLHAVAALWCIQPEVICVLEVQILNPAGKTTVTGFLFCRHAGFNRGVNTHVEMKTTFPKIKGIGASYLWFYLFHPCMFFSRCIYVEQRHLGHSGCCCSYHCSLHYHPLDQLNHQICIIGFTVSRMLTGREKCASMQWRSFFFSTF